MIREAVQQERAILTKYLADFRTTLHRLKGIERQTALEDAQEEVDDFIYNGFLIYVVEVGGEVVGYLVCKVNDGTVWVEQIFVSLAHRRKGLTQLLLAKAEQLVRELGGETVSNYVHPNNDPMISFFV